MLKRKFVATLFGELLRLIPTSSKEKCFGSRRPILRQFHLNQAPWLCWILWIQFDPICIMCGTGHWRNIWLILSHIIIWLWKKRYLVRPFFHHSFISLILMYCRNCKTMFDSRKLCSHLWGWHIQYCTAIRHLWQSLTLMRNFIMTPVTPCFKAFPSPAAQATVASCRISFRAMAMSQWAEQRSVSRRLVGPRVLPKHLVEWHQFGSNTLKGSLKCTFLGLFPFFESLQWAWFRFQPRIPIFDGFWLSDVFRKFSDSLSDLPKVSSTQTIPDQSSNVLPEFEGHEATGGLAASRCAVPKTTW